MSLVSFVLLLGPLGCEEGGKATPDEPAPQSPAEAASSEAEAPAEDDASEDDAEAAEAESPTEQAEPTAKELADAPKPVASPGEAKAPGKPTGPVAGKPWTAVASANAEKGYKCNDAYPAKFIAAGGTNVDYPSKKTRGSCSGKHSVSVSVPYVAKTAGPGAVAGTLKFGICDEGKTNCKVIQKPMTLAFNAAE